MAVYDTYSIALNLAVQNFAENVSGFHGNNFRKVCAKGITTVNIEGHNFFGSRQSARNAKIMRLYNLAINSFIFCSDSVQPQ